MNAPLLGAIIGGYQNNVTVVTVLQFNFRFLLLG